MGSKKIFLLLTILAVSTLIFGCAGQVPPSGGPADTTPPTIIRTVPDSNAIHVEDNNIELEFSEYVDRRSVEESIFISPYVGSLEFDWSGTEVDVHFSSKLKENTTYVVNVGTDVKDRNVGNRMASGYTLAFSTGDSIDRGILSGRVFDEKPEGIMIFAYALKYYDPDTLDPSKVKPDYITQTGKNGLFALSNLSLGHYRLLAVRDQYRNLLYEKQIDQFGVTSGDTTISYQSPKVTDIWFRLSEEDTSKPFLTNVQPLSNRHLRIRFSEPVDSLSFEKATLSVMDTLTSKPVDVLLRSLNRLLPGVVDLITQAPLDSGRGYQVLARGIFDRSGNPIDTANASFRFVGVETPDTIRPSLVLRGIADSSKGIPLDQQIEVDFSEPVLHEPLVGSIQLKDSSGGVISSKLIWLNATDVVIGRSALLRGNQLYSVRILMDSVRDYTGNGYKDSTRRVSFRSLDLRTTGTVEGLVMDQDKNGIGPVYVTAVGVDVNPPRESRLKLPGPGTFSFEQLPEGRYTFKCFRDADSSGEYSFGRPFPFRPSERFEEYPDTVKVRARWGVEGVAIKLK